MLYTHKTHEKDRERLTLLGTVSKWTNIVLSRLTFGGRESHSGNAEAIEPPEDMTFSGEEVNMFLPSFWLTRGQTETWPNGPWPKR